MWSINYTFSIIKKHLTSIIFYILFVFITQNIYAISNTDPELKTLLNKAYLEGSVRIILRPNIKKNTLNKLAKTLDIETNEIRQLNKLNLGIYNVNYKTLKKIINSGLTTQITEDTPSPPSLYETLPRINAYEQHNNHFFGEGYAVAVLDTGVDIDHPFLGNRVVEQACFSTNDINATSLCPNGGEREIGPGAANECLTRTGIDDCNHGTHVAGIIAGKSSESSLTGIAPKAKIIAIQVYSLFSPKYCKNTSGCVLSYESDQLAALEWLLYESNTENLVVVNMSLGSKRAYFPCNGDGRKIIIDQLLTNGVATVIAAGNDGYLNSINSPACIDTAISVSASYDTQELIPSYSNRSPFLDFMAPGTSIYSSVVNGGYSNYAGSSAAAAVVSGTFLLMKERFPNKSIEEIEMNLKTNSMPIYDAESDAFYSRIIFSEHPITTCHWFGSYVPVCHEDNGEWGWENNYSCISNSLCESKLAQPNTNSCHWYGHEYPICTASALDWGWENGSTCITQLLCDSQNQ